MRVGKALKKYFHAGAGRKQKKKTGPYAVDKGFERLSSAADHVRFRAEEF